MPDRPQPPGDVSAADVARGATEDGPEEAIEAAEQEADIPADETDEG